jgi:hypothetical protein
VKQNHADRLQIVTYGVYQYAIIRVLMAIVSLVTQITDRYCPGSNNPAFSHVWVYIRWRVFYFYS